MNTYNEKNEPIGWHDRGYLPHFDGGEVAQFLTIRLFDSVPAEVIAGWKEELAQQESEDGVRATLLRRKIEGYLDQGYGQCWLKDSQIAAMVESALLHFDDQRYRLWAWVIMPNHVHFLFTPLPNYSLSGLMKSLKSWTAKEANKILCRQGSFWLMDYFDRYIRDGKHFDDVFAYIENNPVKAGLCQKPSDWRFSSAWHRSQL